MFFSGGLKVWLNPGFVTDNILKPVCDGIKETNAIIDDKYIRNIFNEGYFSISVNLIL